MTDVPQKPKKGRFWPWLVVIVGIAVWWSIANAKQSEGHHETSPDGKWRVDVNSLQESEGWVVDSIEVRRTEGPARAMRWRVDPRPMLEKSMREHDPVQWSDDSSSVDIVLNGRIWITLQIPQE